MAKNSAVWGIDIGRCALKALRCHMDGDAVVADGFDYIEYPKLLTQPDADAPQLVKEALEQFLSRNSVKGDKVAMSVSGESGLARYFKPPPVDVKKIPDIVKYEARQQIPFALEDVIWDYQRMAGGSEVDGFALDTEIGLFAMKREAVTKALQPYATANIEVDIIQLAPIAIYNYITHDVVKELPEGQEYSSDNPPPSMVVLVIGTDTTDLVVTNGYRVWQRNIPLGGNHFTKQLSKDLKLTFAKAEHLKRNPKQAEDPKAVFQAMRPVFADMVTEVQRSIGFFQSLDRKAKIGGVVVLGNTVKLPGLVQYLSKHLGYEIREIDSFGKLTGAAVVTSPSFKDNLLAFGGCYGLCLQALGKGKLSTNLLPQEILTHRLIRAKKPWAVAGVSALVLAFALSFIFYSNALNQVHASKTVQNVSWQQAIDDAKAVAAKSAQHIQEDEAKKAQLEMLRKIGHEVVGSADRRVLWPELMKAINASLPPMDEKLPPGSPVPDPQKLPFAMRKDLKIEYIETQFFPNLQLWFSNPVKAKWLEINPEAIAAAQAAAATDPNAAVDPNADPNAVPVDDGSGQVPDASQFPGGEGGVPGYGGDGSTSAAPVADVSGVNIAGPTGPGWVIEIKGYHFYNNDKDRRNSGPLHVRNTLIKNLEHGFIDLPLGPGLPMQRFTMKELGISFVILALDPPIRKVPIPNPNYTPPVGVAGTGFGEGPAIGTAPKVDPANPEYFSVPRHDFIIQFCWIETPMNVRLELREQKAIAAKKAAEEAAAAGGAEPAPDDGTAPAPPPVAVPPGAAATAPAGAPPTAPAATAPAGTPPAGTVPAGTVPPATATEPAAPPAVDEAGAPAAPPEAPPEGAATPAPMPAPMPAAPAVAPPAPPVIPDAPM